LLYVHLAVAEQVLAAAAIAFEGVRISAEGTNGFPQSHSVAVFELQACPVEATGIGRATQKRRAESQALLVGEANHFYGVGEPLSAVV
jgi:hypothetical protein